MRLHGESFPKFILFETLDVVCRFGDWYNAQLNKLLQLTDEDKSQALHEAKARAREKLIGEWTPLIQEGQKWAIERQISDDKSVIKKRNKQEKKEEKEERASMVPTVSVAKNRINVSTHVYIIKDDATETYKIGISYDPEARMSSLTTHPFTAFRLLHSVHVGVGAVKVENKLHKLFQHKRVGGEWFRLLPEELEQAMEIMNKERAENEQSTEDSK